MEELKSIIAKIILTPVAIIVGIISAVIILFDPLIILWKK